MKSIDDFIKDCYQAFLKTQSDPDQMLSQQQFLHHLKTQVKQYGYAVAPDLTENSPIGIITHFHGFPPPKEEEEALRCLHRHNYFELIYVYHGEFFSSFEEQTIRLKQGDLLLLNPNVLHSVYTTSIEDHVFDIILSSRIFEQFALAMLRDNPLFSFFFMDSLYSNSNAARYLYFETASHSEAEASIKTILLECINSNPGRENMIQGALMLLFAQLYRMQVESGQIPLHQQDKNIRLFELISYTSKHCSDISLKQLADHFHYSPGYLSKLIFRMTGKHFGELVQGFKLQKATWYLCHTTRTIAEIPQLIGFKDEAYFYRIFKQTYGVSPRVYRMNNRGN